MFVVHRHLENNLLIPNIDFISTIVKVQGYERETKEIKNIL